MGTEVLFPSTRPPTKAVRTSRSFIAVPNNLCPEDILRLQNRRARVESFFRGFEISVQKRVACGNFRTLMRCLRFSGEKLSRTKLFTASSQAKKFFSTQKKSSKIFRNQSSGKNFCKNRIRKCESSPEKRIDSKIKNGGFLRDSQKRIAWPNRFVALRRFFSILRGSCKKFFERPGPGRGNHGPSHIYVIRESIGNIIRGRIRRNKGLTDQIY